MDNIYLTRKMFYWTIGILVTIGGAVMGYSIGQIDAVTDKFNHNFTEVKMDISSLNAKMDIVIKNLDL